LHALVLPHIGEPESPALFVGASLWMGAMVPKRWAKRAVTRNTIKRQIYNVSQEYSPSLQAGAHLVRLRAGFDRSRFVSATSEVLKAAVRAELHQLFQQGVSP
jgi:ribonuclease P protein component